MSQEEIEERIEVCPFCRKKALVVRTAYHDIPHIGKVLLFSRRCRSCGYSHATCIPLEIKDPVKITFKVKEEKDLYVKVVRSPFATIHIPELGLEITPGPLAPMFITNVEGILERAKEAGERFKVLLSDEEEKKRLDEYLKKLIKAKKQLNFTIELYDPYGLSKIIVQDDDQKKRLKVEYGVREDGEEGKEEGREEG